MTTAVTTYAYLNQPIRVIEIEGKPWFVAFDVCKALGFSVKSDGSVNTTHAVRLLNDDEVIPHRMSGFRGRPALIISESGLYKLIMRSDKPEARKFQDWVTREVLPAIRKDGGYIVGEEKVRAGEMDEDELA